MDAETVEINWRNSAVVRVANIDGTAHIAALGYKLNPVSSAIVGGNTATVTEWSSNEMVEKISH